MKAYRKEFRRDDGLVVICEHDGTQRLPTRYLRNGKEISPTPAKPVSVVQKAKHFAKSAARHFTEGMPQATDEQVAERFAVCQACPHFTARGEGAGECAKCGCGLKAVGVAGLNKLRWLGESCPVGRWKPLLPAQPAE
jgi:hypothetical protein